MTITNEDKYRIINALQSKINQLDDTIRNYNKLLETFDEDTQQYRDIQCWIWNAKQDKSSYITTLSKIREDIQK